MDFHRTLPQGSVLKRLNSGSAFFALFVVLVMVLCTAVVSWAQDDKQVFEGSMTDLTPFWWTPDIQLSRAGKKGKLPLCPGTPNSSDAMLWLSMRT
ncbi:hypothetical protein ACL1F4_06975, partial [Corynebacterium striatum]